MSVELIALVGVFLLVIVVFAAMSSNILFNIGTQQGISEARGTVQKLAQAADSVYAQGEGATTSVSVVLPPGSVLEGGRSFIGKPSGSPGNASANMVNLNVAGSDEYALTSAPLSGAFPSAAGTYQLQVTSHGGYVSIGSGLIDVSPGAVFAEGRQGQQTAFPINITLSGSAGGSPVNVSISISPSYGNVGFTASPAVFSTAANTSVSLVFSPSSSAAGIYDWSLQVNASSCSPGQAAPCPADCFTIPVSFEVEGG